MTTAPLARLTLAVASILVIALTAGADEIGGAQGAQSLFGPDEVRPDRQTTSVDASLFQAYDQSLDAGPNPGLRSSFDGPLSGVEGSLSYDRSRARGLSMMFHASSGARYYPRLDRTYLGRQSIQLKTRQPLWRGAIFAASSDVDYSPRFSLDFGALSGMPPIQSAGAGDDSAAADLRNYRAGIAGELHQALSTRSNLTVMSNARASGIEGEPDFVKASGAGVSLAHNATPYTAWRVTYTGQVIRAQASRWATQDVSVGIDHRVPLSESRQVAYSVTAGSTVLGYGQEAPRYRLMGEATASYDIGHSWTTRVLYRRGVGFVDTLPEPLPFDSLAVDLGGLVLRWLELSTTGAIQRGGVGLSSAANQFDVHSLRARLTVSLSRTAAIYVDYFINQYQFSDAVQLPANVGHALDRQGARLGFRFHSFLF